MKTEEGKMYIERGKAFRIPAPLNSVVRRLHIEIMLTVVSAW